MPSLAARPGGRASGVLLARAARTTGYYVGWALGLALLAAAAGTAVVLAGPAALLLPPLAAAALLLALRPGLALGTLLVATVLLEEDPEGFVPATAAFGEPLAGVVAPIDVVLALLVAAVALDLGRRREAPRLPGPFTLPLLVLLGATLGGVVTGYFHGGDLYGIGLTFRTLAYLLLVPFLVVNALHERAHVRHMAVGAFVLASYKGFEGTVGWLLGAGRPFEGGTMTYFAPAANFLLLLFLLCLLAAATTRVPVPWYSWLAAPPALAALTLSYRRSFWVAAGLGLLVVLVLASRRRRFLPVVALLGLSVWVAIAVGGGAEVQNRVRERAEALNPSSVQISPGDRFRLAEQRNVRRELEKHPLTGLGFGVPWTVTSSLPDEQPGARHYVHVTVLWYWLKLGLVGALGYLWLMATGAWSAWKLWRAPSVEPWLRAVGLGILAALLGLLVVETTATFTGVNVRLTIMVGATLGWLAAARSLSGGRAAPPASGA